MKTLDHGQVVEPRVRAVPALWMAPIAVPIHIVHHQVRLDVQRHGLPEVGAGKGHLDADGAQVVSHLPEVGHLCLVQEAQRLWVALRQARHRRRPVRQRYSLPRRPLPVEVVEFPHIGRRHSAVAARPEQA